jgi:hypothetical protein
MTTIYLSPIWIAAIGIISARQLWLYFVAGMRLKMVREAGMLTRGETVLGYMALAEGLLLDLVFHMIFGTLLFLELPARGESATLKKGLHSIQQRPTESSARRCETKPTHPNCLSFSEVPVAASKCWAISRRH